MTTFFISPTHQLMAAAACFFVALCAVVLSSLCTFKSKFGIAMMILAAVMVGLGTATLAVYMKGA